jgi:hypothetical protein
MYNLLTIGADPEVFLINQNQEFISAVGLIGGSKENPLVIKGENTNYYNLLEDNVMVEYNIPPCKTLSEFIRHNEFMINAIKTVIKDGLYVKIVSQAEFNWQELNNEQALQFGCMPSEDAWTKKEFQLNVDPFSTNIRTAGGHIHLGYNLPDKERNIHLVRALDNYLGVYSHYIDLSERNENYGRLGNYREKPYGLEYRTPSNWWLQSQDNMAILFKLIEYSFEYANNNESIDSITTNIDTIINRLSSDNMPVKLKLTN